MQRPAEIQIDADDPWKDDDLERKASGETLAAFIRSIKGSLVVAVEAPWGAGKSTFLRRLGCHLEASEIPVVFIDVWRNDYLQDPMIAYVSAIQTRLLREQSAGEVSAGSIVSALAKHGPKLCGALVTTAAKFLIPGGSETIEAIGDLAGKMGEQLLSFQDEHEKSQEAFRDALAGARDSLTRRIDDQPIRPMVVIVDELDRCRPSFAVQALERIKHFFDVEGVIFLLATDGDNLPAAVSSVYSSVHPQRYLRKFIDYWFHLPAPPSNLFVKYLANSFAISDLCDGASLDQVMHERARQSHAYLNSRETLAFACADVVATFPRFAQLLGLSLRDQTQAFAIIVGVLRCVPGRSSVVPNLLALCACLRFSHEKEFFGLKQGTLSLDKFLQNLLPGFERDPVALAAKVTTEALIFEGGLSPSSIRQRFDAAMKGIEIGDSDEYQCAWVGAKLFVGTGRTCISDMLTLAERFAIKR